ncbi:ABC transporter substrate-binding protein [Mesorhizobium sp. M1A.F.Ca.IN.022.07.1.1]|uniref:ABC transporter substrate-binding protein n=2 Tax=Mesorhizobium TaxID=68287 RepID=UPI000BB0272D|nr:MULTISPECIES: ABC transporter substrate-binding protein [unclassified Mesorhizobium]MDG4891568.1 ABC transporter substrate-binding protein [Mesorhizobium sp. WSM4887]PBB30461.1 branched-chain amino acid ABC transporter substrate-binding protein [Mesorhizobium sp. WSM3882]RUU96795.1 ABC transporter substrate-binding protein [Mesorhizobium sp. M1A.F.Ca.IN.020.03.2.1]RUV82467.1 ABC transporter substrate-binding protein [Mesorhizobium sp. M1A.F.Ca.IN.020.32.1.1]RUV93934.1 ABC transporter substr
MADKNGFFDLSKSTLSRRTALKGIAAGAGLALAPGFVRYSQAQSSAPIKIGFQSHRTGIGAAYGRWYEKTSAAAVKAINDAGGISGRKVELVIEDDGTDPARGAEVVGKFATQHKTDIIFGTLFSHVVIGSAPAAGENKIPYFVVSEGHHVASTKLNRYVFQPGITDVKSQIQSMAPWIAANAGKKVTQIFPDFAFGYDHRDYLPPALKAQGADVIAQIAIPPTESSFTKYFPQIPAETEVIYHVMVGPAVLTFVKELGEFYGSQRPQLFGFIDSLEAVDINSPGLEFLDGSHFWEGSPRYAQPDDSAAQKAYRAAVGIDDNGAAVGDPKDVSTAAHMFGCWETLYVIKKAMEDAGYKGPEDRAKLVEATEALKEFAEGPEHPQGPKTFNGKIHQCFGIQNISKVEGGKLKVVHKTKIEDGLYEPEGDYTTQAL